jgi:hypothetical protein
MATELICIEQVNWYVGIGPNKDEIVTVVGPHPEDGNYLVLKGYEYSPPGCTPNGYHNRYFSPTADISELESILKEQPEHV